MTKDYLYKFTVFTATFNRGLLLNNLFESLKKQSFKNFEWIIVDDGSADNTQGLVSSWIKQNPFPIKYFFQENSGKHVAINLGVQKAFGELFLIVDSDDQCAENALERLHFFWEEIPKDQRVFFSGVFSNCADRHGRLIGSSFPEDIFDSNLLDVYYKYGVKGDKWGFFRTDILKSYPFPVIKNEKFLSEAIVWSKIALRFKTRFINDQLLIVEYREDGLSHNSFQLRRKSPAGAALYYKEFLSLPVPFLWKLRALVNYLRFWFFIKSGKLGN